MTDYEVLIIGGGPGGSRVAELCGDAGMKTALVEAPPVGGTCALSGCNPKKVLAEVTQWRAQVQGLAPFLGCDPGRLPPVEWCALHEYQKSFTEPVPEQKRAAFERRGVELIEGTARFVDVSTVQVNDRRLSATNVVLAVGSRPRPLGLEGEELLTTSDAFLAAEDLPESLAFVGGGYIAIEFAHAAAAAGRRVTVLEKRSRCLGRFDEHLVQRLAERAAEAGIELRTGAAVERVTEAGTRKRVETVSGETVEADWVVHAAGRVANTDSLGLGAAGVALTDTGGVRIDEAHRAIGNNRILAVGDCTGVDSADLASVANLEARKVARNLIDGESEPIELGPTPEVVFSTPRLARVGDTTDADSREGVRRRRGAWDDSGFVRKWAGGEMPAGYLLAIDHEADRLVGAELLHPLAGELINVAATLIDSDTPLSHFVGSLLAYPTAGTQLQDAVRAAIEDPV